MASTIASAIGISWTADFFNLSEVTPTGEVAFEMVLDDGVKNISYRAFRFKWDIYTSVKAVLGATYVVNVYPNPSNGNFNISIEGESNGTASVVVFDEQGKSVGATTINGTGEIDLSGNAAGIYFVKTTTETGITVNRVVIE